MSLKAFHIVFITVASLFSVGFLWWAMHQLLNVGGAGYLVMSLVGLASVIALPVYGRWFLKKMEKVSLV